MPPVTTKCIPWKTSVFSFIARVEKTTFTTSSRWLPLRHWWRSRPSATTFNTFSIIRRPLDELYVFNLNIYCQTCPICSRAKTSTFSLVPMNLQHFAFLVWWCEPTEFNGSYGPLLTHQSFELTPYLALNMPQLGQNRTDTGSIGPVLAQLRHVMACLLGCHFWLHWRQARRHVNDIEGAQYKVIKFSFITEKPLTTLQICQPKCLTIFPWTARRTDRSWTTQRSAIRSSSSRSWYPVSPEDCRSPTTWRSSDNISSTATIWSQRTTGAGRLVSTETIRMTTWRFPCYWPFVSGIHRWPMDSPNKGPCNSKLW